MYIELIIVNTSGLRLCNKRRPLEILENVIIHRQTGNYKIQGDKQAVPLCCRAGCA